MTSISNSTHQPTFWQKHCRKLIDRYFKEMSEGRLIIHWPNGDQVQYGQDENYEKGKGIVYHCFSCNFCMDYYLVNSLP